MAASIKAPAPHASNQASAAHYPAARLAATRLLGRRRLLAYAGAAATALMAPAGALRAQTPLSPTPASTEGPFYPENWSLEPATQLVRGGLLGNPVPLALEGRILDRFGKPVEGARVEIWLADGIGRYTHSRDSEAKDRDPHFAGFGWMKTGADGRYAFSTIRPVPYTGRTPHIHFAVIAPRVKKLVTQMFVEGVAQNERDYLYTHMPRAQRALVTAKLESAGAGPGQRTSFDLVLG